MHGNQPDNQAVASNCGAAPHCGSYYAATINKTLSFPSLQGERRADVCVIGAGFTGVSTALTLVERGYKVVLLEQHRVGWGASGRNGGQLIAGFTGQEKLQKLHGQEAAQLISHLAYRGHEIIAERVEKYHIDCDLSYGYIDVASKRRQYRELKEWLGELVQHGLGDEVELVSPERISDVLGTHAYVGGLISMRNGHLHPLNLCLGEADAAAAQGVEIYEGSPVLDIQHGDTPVVTTADGRVSADFVVLAGNAYQRLERPRLGKLLFPATTYIVATEPLGEELARRLNPSDLAVCDMNDIPDYFRLSADGRLLFGGLCNFTAREPRSIQAALRRRLLAVYPQLEDTRIDYAWGGKIGIVVNRIPLIGRASKNVFYSLGYCGHGVNTSHMAGEIMAEAVAGTFERMDVFDKARHVRLPLGGKLGGHLLALGMLYYRLRDLR